MRRLLTFLLALALVLGTGGAELREGTRPEACGCCETMVPGEPCGCGMPQSPTPQRCGGNTSATLIPARPVAAPVARVASQARPVEAHPFPSRPVDSSFRPDRETSPSPATFAPGTSPPRFQGARLACLSLFRI